MLVFRDLIAFLEADYTVPCRQTMIVRLEKMYSEAEASLRAILSLAGCHHRQCLESIDYGVVRDRDFFTDWVVQSAILQTRSIPERHTARNMNLRIQIFI